MQPDTQRSDFHGAGLQVVTGTQFYDVLWELGSWPLSFIFQVRA